MYDSNGAPALALKTFASHTSVYSAVGNLPSVLYREIARSAGVHIYYEGNDPTYINSRLFGIHMQDDAVCEVALPDRTSRKFVELFDGGETACENGRFTFARQPGVMKLFLLEKGEFSPVTNG